MTKTANIWLNPAGACAMWIEMWTVWYSAALSWWMPQLLPGRGPVAVLNGGSSAKGQGPAAFALFCTRDHGHEAGSDAGEASSGAITGQAMNGHRAA